MMAAVANLHFWKAMPRCGVVECQGIDSMWDFLFKTLRVRFFAEFAWIFFFYIFLFFGWIFFSNFHIAVNHR